MEFSIIIPHKNTPELLQRCIDTIPQREDTELIIIDDASDSSIVDYSNFPGLHRTNTRCVFLNESKGAGYARNIGIECATGNWLLFADADDTYTDCISIFLDKYKKEDSIIDLIYMNAQSYCENNGSITPLSFSRYFERYEKQRFYSEMVLKFNIWTPWTRMVKRDLVLKYGIRYEEIPVGNDKMFSLLCSKYARNIAVESLAIYNYHSSVNGSVTRAYSDSLDTIYQRLQLQYRTNLLYEDVGYIFKGSYLYSFLRGNLRKDNSLRSLYMKFIRSHSISLSVDFINLIRIIWGKLFGII